MNTQLGVATEAPVRARVVRAPADRRFFMSMVVAIAVIVFVGFAPTFYLRPAFQSDSLPTVFAVHGTVFTAWIVLLVVQTALISARRHRGASQAGRGRRRSRRADADCRLHGCGHGGTARLLDPGLPPPLVFFAIPLFDLIVFPLLVGAALSTDERRRPINASCSCRRLRS